MFYSGFMLEERTMKPLSTALAELMKQREMSQADLWATAGLSAPTVSLYLDGKRGLRGDPRTLATIEAMARALDVEPEYFLEYRLGRLIQVAKDHPDLIDTFYDAIMDHVKAEEALRAGGEGS